MTHLKTLYRTCSLFLALLAGASALAAAPAVKTQAPGYYRTTLGDFEITLLSDGTVDLPMNKLLTNTTAAKVDQALARSFLSSPVETSDNAYLINTGSKLVLVDTGAGAFFGPTLGKLVDALKASGYQPEQVDEIYITHMHGDHIGGLVSNGKIVFPNAIVRADRKESDYWVSQAHLDAAKADDKGGYQAALAAFGPYIAAGKFKPFDGDTQLVPGVRSVASHGHTVGHTTYVVESKGQKLVLWGDLMHVAAVQFDDPSVTIAFDTDSKAAEAERRKAYAEAAQQGYWIGATHLPFPALGHLRSNGAGYTWIQANYTRAQ